MMPFIILGTKGKVVADKETSTQTTKCPYCQQIVAMEPVQQKRYFSLFFIPVLPLSKGEAAWRCPACKKLFLRQE